jgi:APA family basic amino acid/polyamine antiporter
MFDLTMIIISLVIGVGIFKTPSIVAQKAASPFIFYMAWILGGVISIFGALTFAEIGARLPVAGGFYNIFSSCYHPSFAFMINWSQLIALAGSAAAISLVGAEYIKPVILPANMQTGPVSRIIALTVMIILFIVNYSGIKMSSRMQNIISGLKIGMILLFCMAVFAIKSSPAAVVPVVLSGSNQLKTLDLALIPVFYSWNGYQYTINFGADIKDPQRNIPRAIFFGISIILILYLAINVAYCQVLGFENLKGKGAIAAELAKSFFGQAGFKITSVMIFISVVGFLNTSLMSNPRVYYAMAEDKILPPIFKRVNEKTQTQEFALSFFFALMVLSLLFLNTFEKILNDIIFINSVALIFGAGTVFILRKRMADSGYSGFRVKPFAVIPILFILFLLFVCGSMFISDPGAAITGIALLVIGFPLYHLIRKVYAIKPSENKK